MLPTNDGHKYELKFLPIQFWSNLNKEDFENLSPNLVLDIVESYLEEKGFNFIKRTENKILFHSLLDGWGIFDIRSCLVSGVVSIQDNGTKIRILNGNWLSLLIALSFLIFIFLANSSFSTLDQNDLDLVWSIFGFLFVANFIIRIYAHLTFRNKIRELIIKNQDYQ